MAKKCQENDENGCRKMNRIYSWIAGISRPRGECVTSSENSGTARKSGGRDALTDAVPITSGEESLFALQRQLIEPPQPPLNLVSSKDLGDPEMGTVLQWHLSLCLVCQPTIRTVAFGQRATQFCAEYFEIIQEYREYEGQYAWKGNP